MKNDKAIYFIGIQFIIIASLFMIDSIDPVGLFQLFLLIALLFITVILLFIRLDYHKQLKQMNRELKRVVNGNLNTRLLANHDPILDELSFLINDLVEQLKEVQIHSIKSHAARKRILTSISHDVRTPLTSVIGYIDALKDDIATSEEEKRDYLEILSRKANSLKQLVDDLFDMAKIDADEISLKEERLNLAEIARESLIEFLPEFKKEGIELKINIPNENCPIIADYLSLIRIIRNLIDNAIRYGKTGRVVGIELQGTGRDYQLLIWDRGPGIPLVDSENLFERMYRGDHSRNEVPKGSGLGLSIAKALVEKNYGRIWVESIPWEKTTFGISFPKYQ